jgi:Na+/proline symporter
VVFFLVIGALVFGALAKEYVFWLVLFAWGGLGASFGPTLLLSLFWKRTSKAGVIAGFVSGTTITILWNLIETLDNYMYHLVPAFVLSLFITVIVSLVTSAPVQAEEELESIRAKYKRKRKKP